MTDSQDIPPHELEDLQGLLRLKNYEQPAEGYFEDFLDEFHRRQRTAAITEKTGFRWSQVTSWFQDLGAARWVIGAGVAYAALAISAVVFFGSVGENSPSTLSKGTEDFLPDGGSLQHVDCLLYTSPSPRDRG